MSNFIRLPAIGKKGSLPNLIVIGAVKCGTTSLHYYMGLHPEISMTWEKEPHFFVRERNWDKGLEWYKSNFTENTMIRGETSPGYTKYPIFKGVPERMHAVVPDAKLIYILRDPIDRMVSNYIQNYSNGNESRTTEEALSHLDDNNPYICNSKYYMQLEQYLNYFPRSHILIITLEDLYNHRMAVLKKIFRFLDVDENFYSPQFSHIKHQSNVKRRKNRIGMFLKRLSETNMAKMFSEEVRRKIGKVLYLPFSFKIERPMLDESLREKLSDCIKDDISRLREYTGCDFKEWSV